MKKEFLFLLASLVSIVAANKATASSRTVDIVNMETSSALTDSGGESINLKCTFLNPSTVTQAFKLIYFYDNAGVNANQTNSDVTLSNAGTSIPATGEISLAPNHSYSFLWCAANNWKDCDEGYIGGPGSGSQPTASLIVPIRLRVEVSTVAGSLIGNCVSHFSNNASRHRSATLSVAGGRPF